METGLGRAGYLMLAAVLFMLGAFGLAATYLAYTEVSTTFFRLGLGVAAVALTGLFFFAAWGPWLHSAPAKKSKPAAPEPTPVPEPAPAAPAPPTPAAPTSAPSQERAIDFEFDDAEPAANAAPDDLVLPDSFKERKPAPGAQAARDPTAWPQRKGRSNGRNEWSAQVAHRNQIEEMVESSPVRAEMQERYTRTTPMVRGILQESQAPLHVAERAPEDVGPGFAAPGMSVGQCGRCKTMVMAPDERPLRLKCPECAKVTSLS